MSSKIHFENTANKIFNSYILLFVFASIILPKINIIKFGDLSCGLRFEDLFIIFFLDTNY